MTRLQAMVYSRIVCEQLPCCSPAAHCCLCCCSLGRSDRGLGNSTPPQREEREEREVTSCHLSFLLKSSLTPLSRVAEILPFWSTRNLEMSLSFLASLTLSRILTLLGVSWKERKTPESLLFESAGGEAGLQGVPGRPGVPVDDADDVGEALLAHGVAGDDVGLGDLAPKGQGHDP